MYWLSMDERIYSLLSPCAFLKESWYEGTVINTALDPDPETFLSFDFIFSTDDNRLHRHNFITSEGLYDCLGLIRTET